MLQIAECSVAVENALPQVKAMADMTTNAHHGEGVAELIEMLVKDDLGNFKISRHDMEISRSFDDSPFSIPQYGRFMMLTGTSGSGKTTFAAAIIEQIAAKQYQFCLVDPEGDYLEMPDVVVIGDTNQPPLIDKVIQLLQQSNQNLVACTLAIPLADRPGFFQKLMNALMDLRKDTGDPHFIILDEAHHLIPKETDDHYFNLPVDLKNLLLISTKPELINTSFLKKVNLAMVMGDSPADHLSKFAELAGERISLEKTVNLQQGEILAWDKDTGNTILVRAASPNHLLQRHKRKYAAGDMGPDSFYFTGAEKKLNLQANNLLTFVQMAKGIDDET